MKKTFSTVTFLVTIIFMTLTQCINNNEKKDINKATQTISNEKIHYENKELTFVQDLLDSTNSIKGKVYVEFINDSVFKRMYIFDDKDLKYFVGDGKLTNLLDTVGAIEDYYGFRFIKQSKYSIGIEITDRKGNGCSDPWSIKYIEDRKVFDNPYRF
jgi:hypothetical protein